mmetsp:Transcript_64497/g.154014  ORF Transcript_64497/g.154014 Transcript_64497/m.154014 type:complete len:274 (-) Transcript_64497:862-1683(-)
MLVCGGMHECAQQGDGSLMLLLRSPSDKELLHDVVTVLIVHQVGSIWQDFRQQAASSITTPTRRVRETDKAQDHSATKTMPCGPVTCIRKLLSNEVRKLGRQKLHNLLNDIVGMRVFNGCVYVAMQVIDQGLDVIPRLVVSLHVTGLLGLHKSARGNLDSLLHECARHWILSGQGPDLRSATIVIRIACIADELKCPVLGHFWTTTVTLTTREPGLATQACIPAAVLSDSSSGHLAARSQSLRRRLGRLCCGCNGVEALLLMHNGSTHFCLRC